MASVVVCALLFRWILPILLLGASCIRINGFSFIYLCCFLIIPLFPNPTRKNFGPCGHTGNLQKAILGLSVIAILAQITFQIVLAAIPPYGHFLPNCTTYEQLAREIGLNRFDAVPAYTVVRYILPDVVVFIISLSCVLCCKKLASSPVSRAESPQSPQRLLAVSDEPTTTDNIMPYVMAAMLLAAGIIQPSVISVIYFLTFLGLGTVWACHKAVRLRHRKAFACIRLILMVYSGIHVMVLYLYQSQIFQDVLPPHNLITRLLGLVGIFYTDCNHPQVLHIKQNVDWPLVSCPGVILLLYWLLATETRIYFTNDSSPSSPNQGISWWNPTTWPEKASSERQSLIAGAQDRRNYNAITAIPEDGVPEEPVQPVSHESRDTEDNPDVQGTLGSIMMFLMRQSYIAALIIMMAWSITYHSWLTFVLLLWACLIWITPFARWFCMVSSPGLVLYAEFLLLVQYIYGLRLKDSELPIQDSTGTFDYAELGLKKWKYPCLHLGAQTLFTWVFWLTLRQHIREKKIKKRARDATHSGIPLTSLAHPFVQALRKMSSLDPSSSSSPPDDVDGMDARASDDAKALMIWVKSVLAKYWILLCCGAFLLVGLQNEVSVYQIGYMAIFLFILICYQISLATWRIVLRPLWWVMVIYSICILLLIYTYQFDNMPVYWHNATGLSDKWLHNLGLRQHTKASLLMELLTPTAFSIIIVIQLHFFHRPFMAMIDIRNARCESNTSATARYQSANGVEDIHHDDAATNSTVDAAEGPTGEHEEPEGSPARTGEHSSPPHGTHQKSVLVTCLIKVVQFYNEVTVLLWRLGELHMVKLVNFILICVVVYQVCAINAIIIILLGISMPSRMVQRALSYCFLIWSSLVILSKMIYQLRFVQADLFQHNCTDKSLPVPANISHFTNNALWVGFYKTDVISEDIKGYLFIVIAIVLQAVIKHHQKLYRLRRGLLDPEPGVLFPSASRKKADVSMIECLKYMVNKFFFHFGWEVSLLVVVYNMAVRCDVTSVIYAIWLGVFLALGRKNCAVVWPVYVGFLAFLLPLQYLLCLGWPPGLCLAYPWTRSLDPNLIHWLYLTDVTYPPDPRLLIGDFLQLLFACCQENVFSLERFSWSSEEPPQPSNTRRSSRHKTSTPDFMWNITWLDFTKLMMFQHLYWITLAVVYITVQSTISIFNIGFILWCFFFLWHGQALYLKPKKKLLRLWKTFICYNYFILLAKVCLQAVSCVWMQAVQDYTGCWPLQLLSMFCLRESGYQNQKAITDSECVAPDDTGLAMDCACVTFLLIQYRIFCSDYFRHVVRDHKEQSEMAYRGAELVNQHLRKQLDSKILEDKQKMDRIKRSVNKLVEKLSKLHPAGVEYAPQSHYEAIYSGDYYWFDSDSESDSEADSQSVSPIHDRTGSLSCSDDDETKSTKQDTEPRPSTSGRSASRTGRESISSNSSSGDYVNVPTPEPSTAIVEPEGLVNKVKRWLSWIYYYIAMVVDSVIKVLREISKDYRSIADKLKRERKEKRIEKLRRSRMSHLHPKPTHSETSDSDTAAETKHHSTKGATDEEYDCLSLVDLEETDAPSWKHSQMRVARFTVAFVYALLAHTDIICYMLMILNHMVYACLLSMPLPFLVFMWGMLSIPRPTKRFWITVITYTQVVIVIKYLFKFPFIEFNTCNGKDGGDKDDPLCYPRILGIERVTHTSAYDLLLLLALYFHRYSLKVHGLWRDKAVHADDTPVSPMSPNDEERLGFERHPSRASTIATETSQDHDGETLWNKIVRSVRAFLHRIYDPETGSGAVDVYAMMFACQFIIFIIILFSWSAFSSPEPQRQAQFVKIVEENVVPKTFLYMLLTQFILIIFDRCFYLRKYVFAKLFYLLFLVVGFHIFMFIIVPYVTKKPFYKNIPAIFMYIFMCMYFGLSAYQIRCGYPTRILGNFLTKSYTLTSGVLFQGFQAIPFVLELRSVLDWACTDTTLSLYHWLKMDDIYANIYVLKCYRESEKTWFQARGQKYWILSKCTLGGLLILLLVLVIWFPLLLMSYINSVYTSNPPQDATFTLSIGGYQPLFRVSAQEQFLQQLNDSQIEKIKQRNPGKGYDKQQIDSFLRDYRERGTVELVKITGNSSSIWQISPPSRELMMLDLLGDKNVTMRFKYEFTREPKTALVQETISGQTLIPLDSTTRRQFAYMLNGTGGQEIVIRDMFPSFVNVPASGSATPITALFNASYVTCGIRMRMSGPSVEWWELTQKSPKPLFEESVLEMIAFNDLVPPLHFSFFASTGIIGLYVGFVWLVGKFVRLFFTSISYRIMFDEMPNVDKVLKLCLDIFMVRESKSFELEEDLFAKLMFLYRSPETLIKWTKYKRH